MFKLLGKLFGGFFRSVILGGILLIGLAGGGYAWWIHGKLQETLRAAAISEGYVTYYELLRGSRAPIETSWPLTVRVLVKETTAHNWIPSGNHGLVRMVLQWSPDQNRWVEEPRDAMPLQKRTRLEMMARTSLNGSLIGTLRDDDPEVREVAFRELKIRTGQDLGYRYDASSDERDRAAAAWEKWWEENKVRWTSGKVLEKVGEILKTSK